MAPAVPAFLCFSEDIISQILQCMDSQGRGQMLCVSRAMRDAVQGHFPRRRILAIDLKNRHELNALADHLANRKGEVRELEVGSQKLSITTILGSLNKMVDPYRATLARFRVSVPEMEATHVILLSGALGGCSKLEEVVLGGKRLTMLQRLRLDCKGVQKTCHVAMFPFPKLVFDFPLIRRNKDSTLSFCTMWPWSNILALAPLESRPTTDASIQVKLDFLSKHAMQSGTYGLGARRCVFPEELVPGARNLRSCHFVRDFATRYFCSETLQELVISLPVRRKDISLQVPNLRVLDYGGGAGLYLGAQRLEELTVRRPMGFLGGLDGWNLKKLVLGESSAVWSCMDILKVLLCVPSVETTELLAKVESEPEESLLNYSRVFTIRHSVKNLVYGKGMLDEMAGAVDADYTRVKFQEELSTSSLKSMVVNVERPSRIKDFLLAVGDVVQKLTIIRHGSHLDLRLLEKTRKRFERSGTRVVACEKCLNKEDCG